MHAGGSRCIQTDNIENTFHHGVEYDPVFAGFAWIACRLWSARRPVWTLCATSCYVKDDPLKVTSGHYRLLE